jgi:hypothetical protein
VAAEGGRKVVLARQVLKRLAIGRFLGLLRTLGLQLLVGIVIHQLLHARLAGDDAGDERVLLGIDRAAGVEIRLLDLDVDALDQLFGRPEAP